MNDLGRIHRILDANLDRAREGLRVIEEWYRFGLNQSSLAESCKNYRQELARWHRPEFWAARDTAGDVGTELTHPQETQRDDILSLLKANFCRTQEALRVLEEYGKLVDVNLSQAMKQLRYQIYQLESELFANQRQQKLEQAYLYLITMPCPNLFNTVEAALQSGLTLVQYRDKPQTDNNRYEIAQKLCTLCHQYNALFIINDRVDIALAVSADGVHLGQQDMPLPTARKLLGHQRIIGCSTTNPDELERAILGGADYVGVGPVYATPTKAGKPPAGWDYVAYVAQTWHKPWFAIGGIDLSNCETVLGAGVQRIAIVRAIMDAENPGATTQQFLQQLQAK
ncbi:thiamine-phosphate pyrophosphorylase [Gloeomargarita lithophora Alchichica-D10]|uniref:Thiamine-phosphate synthase n=1 Tax=Gloeomargarita lithophora Alchichica-D10 TaxID=1188229 RepID=A0A1J0ABZ2_9CYAN|nr:thiamine phosphate synthase [Gloeomargarita lithophora]APB33454.1 thiamine-phosphate pyrophosphorylase [Gloeomargarita lithophora Alchichica-D10]